VPFKEEAAEAEKKPRQSRTLSVKLQLPPAAHKLEYG
jgi:hypothetical protein